MTNVFIDFETRSRVDLRASGVYRYARDESTNVLCMAYAIDDGPVHLWERGESMPAVLFGAIRDGALFHAHNAGFERAMWTYNMVVQCGWPEIPLEQWRCTAAKAAYANHPRSLDGASSRLLPEEYHKDGEGRKIMLKTCKPNSKGEWVEDEDTLLKLYKYCRQDVEVERKLDEVLPDWPDSEVEVWQLNERINDRGVPIDRELCEGAAFVLDQTLKGIASRLSAMTDGRITTGNQVARIREFVAEKGVNMASLSATCVEETLQQKLPDDVRDILHFRQITSGAAAKKYQSALDVIDDDDRARGLFMYYAAGTGRFSSTKTQFQNMKKGGKSVGIFRNIITSGDMGYVQMMYGDEIVSTLGRQVRSMVWAMQGHSLLRADERQIECRVLHWLAGDDGMMDTFRANEDPYIKFARKIFNRQDIADDSMERMVAKAAVLGLGFGMGAVRFMAMLKLVGVNITERFARRVVTLYRKENPWVTQLWNKYEAAAQTCVENGTTTRVGKVIFQMKYDKRNHDNLYKLHSLSDYLTVTLPSGRQLFYYRPEFRQGARGPRFEYLGPRGIRHEWAGGLLTENIVQAVARDILVHAMLQADKAGFKICMHVHDEIIVEEMNSLTYWIKDKLVGCMTQNPKWAAGLPLAAELKVAERYA